MHTGNWEKHWWRQGKYYFLFKAHIVLRLKLIVRFTLANIVIGSDYLAL